MRTSLLRAIMLSCALGACAGAERASAPSVDTAAGMLSEAEQHALRAFDSAPARYFEITEDYLLADASTGAKSGQQVTLQGLQWNQPVVTVAFAAGDEKILALIEGAALEWTGAGRHFTLSFRDASGRFRRWRASDRQPAADIRIGFRSGGYWSLLGRMATRARPGEATMNFDRFLQDLAGYADPAARAEWLASYHHSVVLHEFGHALGLAHEHFHPECQADLKFEPDTDYAPTRDHAGEYMLDANGRSPGALLWYQGAPSFWIEPNANFQLHARTYLQTTRQRVSQALRIDTALETTPAIDQHSVMLYPISPILLREGAGSRCINLGAGRIGRSRFATALSAGDIAYFKRHYDRPLPHDDDEE